MTSHMLGVDWDYCLNGHTAEFWVLVVILFFLRSKYPLSVLGSGTHSRHRRCLGNGTFPWMRFHFTIFNTRMNSLSRTRVFEKWSLIQTDQTVIERKQRRMCSIIHSFIKHLLYYRLRCLIKSYQRNQDVIRDVCSANTNTLFIS